MVTRGNDVEFAGFCNWILQALVAAEAMNITQERAREFPTTHVFGDRYTNMFIDAIAAVGNYGEMYARNFEERIPRQGMNLITDGSNGMLYAHPFGDLEIYGADLDKVGATPNGTMESIESENSFRCGVVGGRPGFAAFNETSQEYTGLDVDYCRAVSAAMFSADVQHVEFITLSSVDAGFSALANEKIDIFAGAPYNMENDVLEPTTGLGFAFSPCYFFEGQYGSSALSLATREDDSQWSDFVRWIVWSIVYAEEAGIAKNDAIEMPFVDLFGASYHRMFRYVILGLGNYGDIYERNLGSLLPRFGANMLHDGDSPRLRPLLSSFGN
jgi:ABC-type amino acid transport substrate-binding protein